MKQITQLFQCQHHHICPLPNYVLRMIMHITASTIWTTKSIDSVINTYQPLVFHKFDYNNNFAQYLKKFDVNNRDCFQAYKHVVII